MSVSNGFSGAHLDLMDGRADLPRVGAVVRGPSLSLPWVVVDAAGREVEPVSSFLRDLLLSDVSPLTCRTGITRICERGRLGFSGVSVIAAITTPYLPPYVVPAAKIGHAGVVSAVGMVFPAGAVTMRQWPFRAGTTCAAGSHLARLVHGMRLQERLHQIGRAHV